MKTTAAAVALAIAGAAFAQSPAVAVFKRDAQEAGRAAAACVAALKRSGGAIPTACDAMDAAVAAMNASGRVVAKSDALVMEAEKAGAFAESDKAAELMRDAVRQLEALKRR